MTPAELSPTQKGDAQVSELICYAELVGAAVLAGFGAVEALRGEFKTSLTSGVGALLLYKLAIDRDDSLPDPSTYTSNRSRKISY